MFPTIRNDEFSRAIKYEERDFAVYSDRRIWRKRHVQRLPQSTVSIDCAATTSTISPRGFAHGKSPSY
jgi:hypothetical protein